MKAYPRFQGQQPPSFRVEWKEGRLHLHFYSMRHPILSFMAGIVHGVSRFLFNTELHIQISPNKNLSSPHHIFFISTASNNNENNASRLFPGSVNMSSNPYESKIGVNTFCDSFPFHVVFDENLNITQLGTALARMIVPNVATRGSHFSTYFDVLKPTVKFSLSSILSRVNSSFVVRTKGLSNHRLSDVSFCHS